MLTDSRVRQFHEEGYLFLPETFSGTEVAILKSEAEAIYHTHGVLAAGRGPGCADPLCTRLRPGRGIGCS
jgi:hypothetical protein